MADFAFHKLRVGVALFTGAANRPDSAIPAGLVITQIPFFLQMDFGKPLHVSHAIPARHQKARRETLFLRKRFAIERVYDQRFRLHRVFHCDAAAKLLFQFESLLAEDDFLSALVGAEENNLTGLGAHAHLL